MGFDPPFSSSSLYGEICIKEHYGSWENWSSSGGVRPLGHLPGNFYTLFSIHSFILSFSHSFIQCLHINSIVSCLPTLHTHADGSHFFLEAKTMKLEDTNFISKVTFFPLFPFFFFKKPWATDLVFYSLWTQLRQIFFKAGLKHSGSLLNVGQGDSSSYWKEMRAVPSFEAAWCPKLLEFSHLAPSPGQSVSVMTMSRKKRGKENVDPLIVC